MIVMNNTHNADKTLADLRDHLARHDKPIAFFFGAGTSCAVQIPDPNNQTKKKALIPAVKELTDCCKKEVSKLGEEFEQAWVLIEAHCKETGTDANVEDLLSQLRMMLSAVGKDDTLSGLNKDKIEKLEGTVRKTIARLVTPDLANIPIDNPHSKFARWLLKSSRQNPVEIFTVNYDVLIEHALELERIPFFDGFVGGYRPFFHEESVRRKEAAPGTNWVRLWKIHGSVTWQRTKYRDRIQVIRGEPDIAGEMIYPSFEKYDESRQLPYSAFTDRLTRFLEQDDALLIVVGFSFGDEHINNLIFGALENKPRTHVYALMFEELQQDTHLFQRANQHTNLIVCSPETGIIGGKYAPWSPIENQALTDMVFELKLTGTSEGKDNVEDKNTYTGWMKIGDFVSFCNFLESMEGR